MIWRNFMCKNLRNLSMTSKYLLSIMTFHAILENYFCQLRRVLQLWTASITISFSICRKIVSTSCSKNWKLDLSGLLFDDQPCWAAVVTKPIIPSTHESNVERNDFSFIFFNRLWGCVTSMIKFALKIFAGKNAKRRENTYYALKIVSVKNIPKHFKWLWFDTQQDLNH